MVRVTCPDVVSPSYFVATAAVELGFFKAEGIDAEFQYPSSHAAQDLADGSIDFFATSPYVGLTAFPEWQGAKMLCALSHHTYWFLAVRADLGAKQGDVSALKGHRISASGPPGMALRQTLITAGIDFERDNVEIVPAPRPGPDGNHARIGVQALREGISDAYWGNAMRAEYGVRQGIATILLDIRRGDGPPAARDFTFPALIATERLVEEQPEVAAGAVRAIVRAQKALKADPSLATQVARKLFPAEEAELIAGQIARDAEFYDATITEDMVAKTAQFTRDIGLISGPIGYEQAVATQFAHLWTE